MTNCGNGVSIKSMFPRVDTEADDRLLAQCLCGLQPVQALDQDEARAFWPSASMLCAISSTRFWSSVARRLTGTYMLATAKISRFIMAPTS
jgi:hypothetical protein